MIRTLKITLSNAAGEELDSITATTEGGHRDELRAGLALWEMISDIGLREGDSITVKAMTDAEILLRSEEERELQQDTAIINRGKAEGRAAYANHVAESDNPYPQPSTAADAGLMYYGWGLGWSEAWFEQSRSLS